MRIEGIGPIGQPEPKDKKNEKSPNPANTGLDKVDITSSEEKINGAGYGDSLKNAIIARGERAESYARIRRQTSSGYYDEPDVIQSTSDKFLESMELIDIVDEYHQANKTNQIGESTTEIRHEKVTEIKKKLEQGFYDDPANFQSFAQKLIDHFGL
jgi:anti-sigma28 factor (negative regulator of flagellin synthesis)